MKKTWFALFLSLALLTMAASPTDPSGPRFEVISIVQLIAEPDKYDGKAVLVSGFLRLEFEGNILYMHKEDYEYGLYKNAVWIVRNKEIDENAHGVDLHYVELAGTFSAKEQGHRSLTSGSIRDIDSVRVLTSRD